MLTERRQDLILKLLEERGSISVSEVKDELKISESTIRRDLTALHQAGKLTKVFGGAVSAESGVSTLELSVEQKAEVNNREKQRIARYAAALIKPKDLVYLDAGTTTGHMLDFLTEKSATYVTNAINHAQKLSGAGFRVYLLGGELRSKTEAVVGTQAVLSIQSFRFSKAFLGANGISLKAGFTTPDYEEALMKRTAMAQAQKVYVLADYSKFDLVSSITFGDFEKADILTYGAVPGKYAKCKNVEIVK